MAEARFVFTEPFGDARLAELRLLSWAEQQGCLTVPPVPEGPWRDLLLALLSRDMLTTFSYADGKKYYSSLGQGSSPDMASGAGITGESLLERYAVTARVSAMDQLYQDAGGRFRLTHLGRVRASELKQALRSGREREALGILWDGRHWEQELQVALVDACQRTPVSVAFMDMNGLKALNDQHGHAAGDAGLRMYFQAVASALGDRGQAYRLGGDEVLAVLPTCKSGLALKLLQAAAMQLMRDSASTGDDSEPLSIAVGLVAVEDAGASPDAVRNAADTEQYRAKDESRKASPRPSVIAVDGELIVINHDAV